MNDSALDQILTELGISKEEIALRGLVFSPQPPLKELVVVDIDFEGKPFLMVKDAARAWKKMVKAANRDGIVLQPFSGFRSYLYQRLLIRRHLDNGRPIADILTQMAPPGYSEHHTGRAVDLTTPGYKPLTEELEGSDAFAWLRENAGEFRFFLSFPRNNSRGFIYEPWHWCFH